MVVQILLPLTLIQMQNIDNGLCIDPIVGCTNEFSPNYNADTNVDDGHVDVVVGCTDPSVEFFDPMANYNNGTCVSVIYGCKSRCIKL